MSEQVPLTSSVASDFGILRNQQAIDCSALFNHLRNSIWGLGISLLVLGVADRFASVFSDSSLSDIEIVYLLIPCLLLASWVCLKPEASLSQRLASESQETVTSAPNLVAEPGIANITRQRMLELHNDHLVSQEYTLPFPYLCQIYHLLNLKHLETVHHFSLNNLKVVKINNFQATQIGGVIKFQTVLESPINLLRIWRQPVVEVELTLHTPYTVELSIPVYGDKRIHVMFNAIPINHNCHRFYVDIYSNLGWPKPMLQTVLHFAAGVTLVEDLPYLQHLAEKNLDRLMYVSRASSQEMMMLYRRFVDLYGVNLKPALESA